MSRVGKQLIAIPAGVEVKINDSFITVQGPKGQLQQAVHPQVSLKIENQEIKLNIRDETDKKQRALWGLFGSLVKNMILGVTSGFSKQLEIKGVGFKAAATGQKLVLNVGFSHPVNFAVPAGIEVKVEGNIITVSGFDKQLVGETAAQIRKIKKPEPYKGKGIKYVTEQIRRKAGKTAGSK